MDLCLEEDFDFFKKSLSNIKHYERPNHFIQTKTSQSFFIFVWLTDYYNNQADDRMNVLTAFKFLFFSGTRQQLLKSK